MASASHSLVDVLEPITKDMPVKDVLRLMSTSTANRDAIRQMFGADFFTKLERVKILYEARQTFQTDPTLFKATYCDGQQLTPQHCELVHNHMVFFVRSCDVPIEQFNELYENQHMELLSYILDTNPNHLFQNKNELCDILALKPDSPSLLCDESMGSDSDGGSKRKRKSKRKSKRNIKRNIKRYKRKTLKKKKLN